MCFENFGQSFMEFNQAFFEALFGVASNDAGFSKYQCSIAKFKYTVAGDTEAWVESQDAGGLIHAIDRLGNAGDYLRSQVVPSLRS